MNNTIILDYSYTYTPTTLSPIMMWTSYGIQVFININTNISFIEIIILNIS